MTYIIVFIGGVVGALARYFIDRFVKEEVGQALPWGTLAVNVIACIILGAVMGGFSKRGISTDVVALLGTGFCGALSTFSTFSNDTYKLIESGLIGKAYANIGISLVLGLVSIFGAYAVTVAVL